MGKLDDAVLWLYRRIGGRGRVGLSLYGLLLGGVGLFDVYRGLDLGARADGAALVVVATLIVSGCVLGLSPGTRTPLRRWARLWVSVAALLVSGWIIFRVQSNFVFQPVLVTTVVVACVAASVAVCMLWGDVREGSQPPAGRAEAPAATTEAAARATLTAGKLTAAAGLLGVCLTLPQFWYSARWEPSNAPPVLAVENTIDDLEIRGDHVEFTVGITLKNTGKTPVRMLTSLYEITGTDVSVKRNPTALVDLPLSDIMGGNYGSAARVSTYAAYGIPQLIQAGPVGEDYAWIGPGEEYGTTLRAHVPAGRFNLLRITSDVAVARADRVTVEDWPQSPNRRMYCAGTDIAQTRRPIAHRGAFDRLTESDRELVTFWVFDGDYPDLSPWWAPFPWTGVSIQHAGHGCDHAMAPDHDGLEDSAMVGWASTVAEAAVPEPSEGKP
ncbi:hypothetical protein ACPB9J_31540 [Streptomyces lavendulocolor]|uniref:hypothetical protein n=1 Tax=Streptomyces lavendulocolor TaxID=67316 RepID=UPI003C2C6004